MPDDAFFPGRDEVVTGLIDADDDAQLRRWAQRLGVTPEELKDAVRAVGRDAQEVQRYVQGGGRRTP